MNGLEDVMNDQIRHWMDRAEAAEADARRWRKFVELCEPPFFAPPWSEADDAWCDVQAAIDAELAKEAK